MGKTIGGPTLRGGRATIPEDGPVPVGDKDVKSPRELKKPVTIAVICPTFNRQPMHESLYKAFDDQDYEHKQLWVLDDSQQVSSFLQAKAAEDPRVHYIYDPTKGRMHVGTKRNRLVKLATDAGVIAHFDDDDWYAPKYLSTMLDHMIRKDADLVKLAAWKEWNQVTNHRTKMDVSDRPPADLWGWGFSYVYRRYAATLTSFPDRSWGEDYVFYCYLCQNHHGKAALVRDDSLAEHRIHGANAATTRTKR